MEHACGLQSSKQLAAHNTVKTKHKLAVSYRMRYYVIDQLSGGKSGSWLSEIAVGAKTIIGPGQGNTIIGKISFLFTNVLWLHPHQLGHRADE